MLVMVKYLDGNYDMVVSHHLDGLIKTGRILEFRRGDGWARVGRDPIRASAQDFRGEDRRRREFIGQVML
jgi:hypothetical protein